MGTIPDLAGRRCIPRGSSWLSPRAKAIARSRTTWAPAPPRSHVWRTRFEQDRLAGLKGLHKGGRPRVATGAVEARVVRRAQQKPGDGGTHWSCRKLARELGLSKSTVQRILTQARLKPHRLDRYVASNDPDFVKAADIIGLHLNPPQHAAVFCVDEKTSIQALDRLDSVLPLSPGRAERTGFEYYRHGTLSLYAAPDVKDGQSRGQDRGTAYQCRVPVVYPGVREKGALSRGNSFFLPQSGGDMVCRDPTRRDRSRNLYFCSRSSA